MNSKEVYRIFLQEHARANKHPYNEPKRWEQIMKSGKWRSVEQLTTKAAADFSLIDMRNYIRANFDMRQGKFFPHQFLQKNSLVNYHRWKSLPQGMPEIKKVKESMLRLVAHMKLKKMSMKEIFSTDEVYPEYLRLYAQGILHPLIFTYYTRKIDQTVLYTSPQDVVEHAFGMPLEDLQDQHNVWWLRLLNDDRSMVLIKQFFERIP